VESRNPKLQAESTGSPNKRTLRILTRNVSRLLDAPALSRALLTRRDLSWKGSAASQPDSAKNAGQSQAAGDIDHSALSAQWESQPVLSINSIRRLDVHEELRFILMAKAGDRFAQHKLIVHHLPLLKMIAKRYQKGGLALEELINEGTFGLARAIERFDVSRKVRFGTYAKWWIRDALEQSLINQGRLIRLPRHVVQDHKKQKHAEAHGADDQQAADTQAEDGADEFKALSLAVQAEQLTEVVGSAEDSLPHDGIEEMTPEALVNDKQHRLQLQHALSLLNERERKVIENRFGLHDMEPRTLEAIAQEIGVSCERVRQIQKSALGKLKLHMGL